MATPWDRAAAGYLEEWVPRFAPYHLDLVRELALRPGARVLVVSCGPGAEVLAAARAVGDKGRVLATDKSEEMVRVCREQVDAAGFGNVTVELAETGDARGGSWDAILCAFALWPIDDRAALVRAWAGALAPHGKLGVLTWGPKDGDGPFQRLLVCLRTLEPGHYVPSPYVEAERDAMTALFEQGGLSLVRHTVVSHTLAFRSAEHFVRATREAWTWRRVWDAIGDQRAGLVAAAFYDAVGGPDTPLSFDSPATIAIAGRPGDEIELENRPSLRVPQPSLRVPKS
jgi:ubiquinone/menaquinone biosynthesis C-methylase UbiE